MAFLSRFSMSAIWVIDTRRKGVLHLNGLLRFTGNRFHSSWCCIDRYVTHPKWLNEVFFCSTCHMGLRYLIGVSCTTVMTVYCEKLCFIHADFLVCDRHSTQQSKGGLSCSSSSVAEWLRQDRPSSGCHGHIFPVSGFASALSPSLISDWMERAE